MDITRGPSQALGHTAFYLGPPAPVTSFPVISLEWEAQDPEVEIGAVSIPPGENGSRAAEMAQRANTSVATQAWWREFGPPLLMFQNKSLIQWCTSVISAILLEIGDRDRITQKLTDWLGVHSTAATPTIWTASTKMERKNSWESSSELRVCALAPACKPTLMLIDLFLKKN